MWKEADIRIQPSSIKSYICFAKVQNSATPWMVLLGKKKKKGKTESKCWWRCEKTRTLMLCQRSVKWYSCCGKQYAGSSKIKHKITIWFSNPPSRHISWRTESTHWNRYVHTNDHSSIIQNSQKVETTQCPWMDDWTNVVYPYYRIIFCLKKEGYSDTCYNMDEV